MKSFAVILSMMLVAMGLAGFALGEVALSGPDVGETVEGGNEYKELSGYMFKDAEQAAVEMGLELRQGWILHKNCYVSADESMWLEVGENGEVEAIYIGEETWYFLYGLIPGMYSDIIYQSAMNAAYDMEQDGDEITYLYYEGPDGRDMCLVIGQEDFIITSLYLKENG